MDEAQRALPGRPREWTMMVEQARDYAEMALRRTREFTPEVVARFGVEVIYDLTYRTNIRNTLSDARPSLWYWTDGVSARGRHVRILVNSGDRGPGEGRGDGYAPPIPGPAIPRLRRLPSLVADAVNKGYVCEPEWANKPLQLRLTYLWAMDSVRPPLASMKVAAEIIGGAFSHPTVVGYELGHSVATQAFAVWLGHDVHTDGELYEGDGPCKVGDGKAHAVVVNITCLRLIAYLANVLFDDHIDRRLNDVYWRRKSVGTSKELVEKYLDDAIRYVRPGGLLIVLGDVEDGVHHQAVGLMGERSGFRSYVLRHGKAKLDTVQHPVLFSYARRPWCPFGVVPPSDRMMSAWRRVP